MNNISPAPSRSVNTGRETRNRGSFEVFNTDPNPVVPVFSFEATQQTVPVLWGSEPRINPGGFAESCGTGRIEQEIKGLERLIRGRAAEVRRKYGRG